MAATPLGGSYLELHTDGSALYAEQIYQPQDRPGRFREAPVGARIVTDEHIPQTVLGHVQLLARHAIDNGGVWGEATVATVLTDGGDETLGGAVSLCHTRNYGLLDQLGTRLVAGTAVRSTATVDAAAIVADAKEAIATRLLGGGLVNAFGCPELYQITGDGALRRRYINQQRRPAFERWAARRRVHRQGPPERLTR